MDNVDNEWEQFVLQFNEFSSVSSNASSTFTETAAAAAATTATSEIKTEEKGLINWGYYSLS